MANKRKKSLLIADASNRIWYPPMEQRRQKAILRSHWKHRLEWENEYGMPYGCMEKAPSCLTCYVENTCTRIHDRFLLIPNSFISQVSGILSTPQVTEEPDDIDTLLGGG